MAGASNGWLVIASKAPITQLMFKMVTHAEKAASLESIDALLGSKNVLKLERRERERKRERERERERE